MLSLLPATDHVGRSEPYKEDYIYIQLRITIEKVGVKQASQKPFLPQAWSNVKLTTSLLPAADHVGH